MRIPRIFFNPLVRGVLALILCYAWMRTNCCGSLKVDTDVHWNLASAEKQLREQVHGQASAIQQLLDSLQWTQQKADHLKTTYGSYSRVIFLLGGPGVGKTEAIRLISENIKCQFRGVWAMIPCATNPITRLSVQNIFINQVYDDYPKYLQYHGAALNMLEMELSGFKDEHAERFSGFELFLKMFGNELPRSVLLVSGSVMTKSQLKSLTPKQYDQLLDRYALQITKAMNSHAESIEFTIIKLAKLKPRDMMKYMHPNSSDNEQNLYEIDEKWEEHLDSMRDDKIWTMRRSSTEPVDNFNIIHSYLLYLYPFYQLLLPLLILLLVATM